jgi:hypothetical protein
MLFGVFMNLSYKSLSGTARVLGQRFKQRNLPYFRYYDPRIEKDVFELKPKAIRILASDRPNLLAINSVLTSLSRDTDALQLPSRLIYVSRRKWDGGIPSLSLPALELLAFELSSVRDKITDPDSIMVIAAFSRSRSAREDALDALAQKSDVYSLIVAAHLTIFGNPGIDIYGPRLNRIYSRLSKLAPPDKAPYIDFDNYAYLVSSLPYRSHFVDLFRGPSVTCPDLYKLGFELKPEQIVMVSIRLGCHRGIGWQENAQLMQKLAAAIYYNPNPTIRFLASAAIKPHKTADLHTYLIVPGAQPSLEIYSA